VGIHTVISTHNVGRLPEIHRELKKLQPDSYITEVARGAGRAEDDRKGDHTERGRVRRRGGLLISEMRRSRSPHPMGRLVESFRLEYYRLVKEYLEPREQSFLLRGVGLGADRARRLRLGMLHPRRVGRRTARERYDFGKVWFSPEADRFRAASSTGNAPAPSPTRATPTC